MTDAAPALTLSPPAIVEQLLAHLGVSYQTLDEHAGLNAAQRVQAVLLEDAVGALLVLYPRSQLLDLSRLAELTGRQLHAMNAARLEQILAKQRLANLPGLAPISGTPALYEESLLQAPSLYIDSGTPGLLLEIDAANFKKLLSKASAAQFGEPLSAIELNLNRPLDDRKEITQAVNAFTTRRIQQRLEQTIEIPPLPATAQRIIKLRVDPNATIDDITGIVETDPSLAAQVVSWAASPYYAAPGKIRSVEDAIVRVLGFDLVINLALGLALGKTLSLPKDHPQHSTPYWQQSIYTAAVIEGLTRIIPRNKRPEAGLSYLAGLLHNFGYLVLAHVFPPHFSLICRHLEVNPHLPSSYIEQHLLGITREQIGAWLMDHWDMPAELSCALRFQHNPAYDGEHAVFANLTNLALSLLRNHGIGRGPQCGIADEQLSRLGISREQAYAAVQKVLDAEIALRELAAQFTAPH